MLPNKVLFVEPRTIGTEQRIRIRGGMVILCEKGLRERARCHSRVIHTCCILQLVQNHPKDVGCGGNSADNPFQDSVLSFCLALFFAGEEGKVDSDENARQYQALCDMNNNRITHRPSSY